MRKKKVSIIGFGRFGQLLAKIFSKDFEVQVFDVKNKKETAKKLGVNFVNLEKIFKAPTIFYAVPISKLKEAIKNSKKYIKDNQTILDVCSVKVYPKQVFEKELIEKKVNLILTHPMFGPDSVKNTKGNVRENLKGLKLVIYNLSSQKKAYNFWKKYFQKLGLKTVEIPPEKHDKFAAFSQGVTHYIGRVLEDMKLKPTPIDTIGFETLLKIKKQTCNDTWQLFSDLQTFNPFTKKMRIRLEKSSIKIYNKLLPKRIDPKYIIIGIQGGEGSFNEEACRFYCREHGIKNFKIKYLYTSNNVLKKLHQGEIDFGQFALQNSVGGTVKETIDALSQYNCKIVKEFQIIVSHCLLARKGVKINQIKKIISHPQALAQCKSTLAKKYPDKKLISGKKNLIDQAQASRYLSEGKLPKSIAVLAPKICAQLYNLDILAEGLQDRKDNYTSFLFVKRR